MLENAGRAAGSETASSRPIGVRNPKVRVAVCVEHPVMRAGWESILSQVPDVDLGHPGGGTWDVTFVDVNDTGYLEAVGRRATGDSTPILAAVDETRASVLRPRILDGTVRCVINSEDDVDEIHTAVMAAARGHLWISAPLAGILADAPIDPIPDRDGTLTAREYEMARMLLAGATNSEIAEVHAISISTVKFHVSNLMRKLGVCRRSQIANALRTTQDN